MVWHFPSPSHDKTETWGPRSHGWHTICLLTWFSYLSTSTGVPTSVSTTPRSRPRVEVLTRRSVSPRTGDDPDVGEFVWGGTPSEWRACNIYIKESYPRRFQNWVSPVARDRRTTVPPPSLYKVRGVYRVNPSVHLRALYEGSKGPWLKKDLFRERGPTSDSREVFVGEWKSERITNESRWKLGNS